MGTLEAPDPTHLVEQSNKKDKANPLIENSQQTNNYVNAIQAPAIPSPNRINKEKEEDDPGDIKNNEIIEEEDQGKDKEEVNMVIQKNQDEKEGRKNINKEGQQDVQIALQQKKREEESVGKAESVLKVKMKEQSQMEENYSEGEIETRNVGENMNQQKDTNEQMMENNVDEEEQLVNFMEHNGINLVVDLNDNMMKTDRLQEMMDNNEKEKSKESTQAEWKGSESILQVQESSDAQQHMKEVCDRNGLSPTRCGRSKYREREKGSTLMRNFSKSIPPDISMEIRDENNMSSIQKEVSRGNGKSADANEEENSRNKEAIFLLKK
ncbi:hypothetical protein RND71_009911 [Anisodus tanguticus]|uniref:Uncharacterized protein n=1 Tax=Anisodus tanguticus TaxID=243964 RepID=A0AAE1VNC4_9SOLA|nr:hypothetical protein RND71_009911 [Anisodus tanguticus]